jgi:hypothetical protein
VSSDEGRAVGHKVSEFRVQQIVEKLFSESFDDAQDERMIPKMIEKFPFMLRFSKHSEPFLAAC